ncbi:penicillin-binding protein 1A [Devosia enhydra]|uniref:Penicillin-binding protein 1A n=1 Tax=Devosia enhydra TaxID=665118 RepID=A0A1K2HZ12_9HYPH|nr:PBP1A family penicillin-binding protein [Devosia enhydra]SFZ84972.1 penicillin-binding protein 1A [Devosia enhydra]
MRKKSAGAPYMDLHLSPEDRVGAAPGKPASKPRPARKGSARAERVEPQLGGSDAAFALDAGEPIAPERRGKAKPAKARKGRREKRPLTFGWFVGKLFYWGFVLAVWGGIAIAGVVAYYAVQLPAADSWAVPERPANIRIVAANGQLISNRGQMGGEAVALRELPHYVPAAVLAIEDRRFYEHFGVDPIGILRAFINNTTEGRITGGGSTITQQLAKNLFLTPDQNYGRKIQEALLSLWLERNYTKEDILELYLNRVFFGHNSYGIEAASQTYFGKSARNLSLGEAAILAGSLQAPSRLNPRTNPEASATRARLVLGAMAEEGYISQAEADAAAIDPNKRIRTRVAGAEYYVADWVESLMTAYLGEVKQDVIVSTTIDWDLQKHAEFVVKEMVTAKGSELGFSQGALVAMETDGTVRAIVGGTDYGQSQFNRAVTSRRQPGSAFKPFVWMAAMEKGYTPDTVAEDAPFNYEGWAPENAGGQYRGQVTLRDALAYSLNTIAAKLAIDVTPQAVVEAAMRMGISANLPAVPSIALGTAEVSLLELTAAYAPFANGGQGVIANVITRIETVDGQVLYESIPAGPGEVVSPVVVAEMNDMLHTAVEIGTGKRAQLDGWPMAGKTGTSQKARDAVFVGYTARMVTGVWLGNDDDTATKLAGGSVPVEIWSQFMSKAHEGYAVAELPGMYGAQTQYAQPDLQPMEQAPPQRTTRTIVDLLGEIFGGRQ